MTLPETTPLAKVIMVLACATFLVNIVGFSTGYWLEKSFMFPLNRGGVVDMPVDARLGLFTACETEHYLNGNSHTNCITKGAADWQIISAALAIAGLVFALLGAILSVLGVVRKRLAGRIGLKVAILLCHFLACNFFVGPLLMFPINKTIQIKPDFSPFKVDFGLGYSYIVAAASTVLFAFLVLLNIIDLIWSRRAQRNIDEDRTGLTKAVSGLTYHPISVRRKTDL
ncbi:unnamed protein product [Candidula unifasciata]|uniref:Uncharacterized protein n=1 Tax=Candidula unifasciata TaxID=100452 RepID=A0A8S3ZZI9_9EUPU|nr:unnamed protein product [Candidula unifasciata]